MSFPKELRRSSDVAAKRQLPKMMLFTSSFVVLEGLVRGDSRRLWAILFSSWSTHVCKFN